jgi:hypothetical protein
VPIEVTVSSFYSFSSQTRWGSILEQMKELSWGCGAKFGRPGSCRKTNRSNCRAKTKDTPMEVTVSGLIHRYAKVGSVGLVLRQKLMVGSTT